MFGVLMVSLEKLVCFQFRWVLDGFSPGTAVGELTEPSVIIKDHGVRFCGNIALLRVVLLAGATFSEFFGQNSLLGMKEDVVVF